MPLGAGDGASNSGAVRPEPSSSGADPRPNDRKKGSTSGLQTWAQETAGAVNGLLQQDYRERNTGAVQDLLSYMATLGAQRDSTGFDVNSVTTAETGLAQAQAVDPLNRLGYTTREDGTLQSTSDPMYQLLVDKRLIPNGVETPDKLPDIPTAEAKVEAARDAQRRRALGSDVAGPYKAGTPAPGAAGNKVHEMTMRRYEALSPKERAAVDFNTLLVQAVKADADNQLEYAPTPQQQATYDALVTKTFGEDDGTDYYAPEVMGLLQQIGYQDDAAKLQDFLGLNAAITKGDLKNLKTVPGPTVRESQLNPVQQDQYQLTETLATSTMQMEQQMAKANALLASIPESARLANVPYIAEQLGALPSQPDQIYGYGEDETSKLFQKGYGILVTKSNQADKDLILTQMNDRLTPAEFKEFLKYVDVRSANAQQYGLQLADVPEGGDPKALFTPEKFRTFMGLDEGFSDG